MNNNLGAREIALGIGTTGNCNMSCGHCYSLPLRGNTLSFADIKLIIEGKKVSSINFGTGENILNPEFADIVNYCYDKNIKTSLTSNGYSINALPDDVVGKFNDIDISMEFMDENSQNDFRKGKSWNFVQKGIEKCKKLGVEFSIATALMNVNYKEIPSLLEKVRHEECNLRLNIFKPVPKAGITKFTLSYDEFWEAVSLLFEHGNLVSCSEPVVSAMLEIKPIVEKSPCGQSSLRIHPTGEVVPCVYWPDGDVHINDLESSYEAISKSQNFKTIQKIPDFCLENCDKVNICGGGCAARRYLNGDINEPDQYCPIYLKKEVPKIAVRESKDKKDLVHASYLCTFIFNGK